MNKIQKIPVIKVYDNILRTTTVFMYSSEDKRNEIFEKVYDKYTQDTDVLKLHRTEHSFYVDYNITAGCSEWYSYVKEEIVPDDSEDLDICRPLLFKQY